MTPRRILVAIDASPLSLLAAGLAARLADHLGAAMEGVYVEDVNLARLAEHPEGALISVLHARRHPDHHQIIAQALKLQATQARRGFEAALGHRPTTGGFHVRHGRVAAEMLAAAAEADLLVLGWHGAAPSRRSRLGSVAHAVAAARCCPVLILRRTLGDRPHIATLPDDLAAAAWAGQLAGHFGHEVEPLARLADAHSDQLLVTTRQDGLDSAAGAVLLVC